MAYVFAKLLIGHLIKFIEAIHMKQNRQRIAIKMGCYFLYYEFFLFTKWMVTILNKVLKAIKNNRRSHSSSSMLTEESPMIKLFILLSYRIHLLLKCHPKKLLFYYKKIDNICKHIKDCCKYHNNQHAMTNNYIAFDLDDGVVVNYAKFSDVLMKLK